MAYHQKPSDALRLTHNAWLAWQVDQAVFTFGRHVEYELEQVKGQGAALQYKRKRKLAELLGQPMPSAPLIDATSLKPV